MASFHAKEVWKRTRKSENKTCISVPFLPEGKYKTPKKVKKLKKNTIVASFQAKIRWKMSTKERK